jgi:hypothetical protein
MEEDLADAIAKTRIPALAKVFDLGEFRHGRSLGGVTRWRRS